MVRSDTWRLLSIGAAITLAYVASAQLGFQLAFAAEQVTTVWAPTGIAIAALLLWSARLWPAIWLGAFLANAATNAPLWTALVIASGNTLEALAAAWGLGRLQRFDPTLRRVTDVLAFMAIGAALSTTLSATVGVATLGVAGVQPWDRFAVLWFDWWLGDALGAVVVTPAILTSVQQRAWFHRNWWQVVAFVGGAALITHLVFGELLGLSGHPIQYVVFPVVIAAALVGGPPLTSLVVLSASTVAILHTVRGAGPFATSEVHQSLILLQVFMGVLAGTALLLAAAIAERTSSEQREKAAAEGLREREQMLWLAMRGGAMGAWSRNLATNEVWWSRELEEIVGLPAGTFDRSEAGFFEYVHPDDRDRVRRAVDSAIEGGSDYFVEFRFRHGGGEWRWMEGRGRAVYDDAGHPRSLYGIGIDVTARKRAEIALQEAKNAAESANHLKDQFLATLSHELRTPLNVIFGYARMLQTNSIPVDPRQQAIDVIERNAVAQSQLIEDLLDMSRITTGKLRLTSEPIAIAPVLRDALEGVPPAADAKRVVVDVNLDPFAGMVTADRTRLQQVFWNLLTNAVKFTGQGGHVNVSLRRDGDHVEITVSDNGLGIAPDFLPYVFEPFRQATTRLARAHGGLGLGLAIAKQLVELHGGTIDASSGGEGHGATFFIRLPRLVGD